ncbi:MAG: hypothetical protein COB24_10075 [Hyphomicrobiales bacterium]|nr:MAG: hypothetical protein COB24_10075 [Hyphomicrobiales bacterium]
MGLKIIVDDIVNGNEELQLWKILLKSYRVIYVGVFCDETELKRREKTVLTAKLARRLSDIIGCIKILTMILR